jgi:hypothetical protein
MEIISSFDSLTNHICLVSRSRADQRSEFLHSSFERAEPLLVRVEHH